MNKILLLIAIFFSSFPVFARDKEVKAFVEKVYADVVDIRNSGSGDYECLVERYCSSLFRLVYDEARQLEKKTGEAVLHFGGGAYDLFVQCQDYFDSVEFKVLDIERNAGVLGDVYCATVAYNFTCDSYEEKEWVFNRNVYVADENGEWRISDFRTPGEKSDSKIMIKALLDFVKADIKNDEERLAAFLKEKYDVVASSAVASYDKLKNVDTSVMSQKIKDLFDEVRSGEDKLDEVVDAVENWVKTQECWNGVEYEISNVKITAPGEAKACVVAKRIASETLAAGKTIVDLAMENGSWVVAGFTDYMQENSHVFKSDTVSLKERVLEMFKNLIE